MNNYTCINIYVCTVFLKKNSQFFYNWPGVQEFSDRLPRTVAF
jgi:hypothetical protein